METAAGIATCVACERPLTIDLANAPTVSLAKQWGVCPANLVSAVEMETTAVPSLY